MADSRTTVLCLLLVTYFIFANDSTVRLRDAASKQAAQNGLQEAHDLLSIVGNSSSGDITNVLHSLDTTNSSSLRWNSIELAKQYEWTVIPEVQTRARDLVNYALGTWGTDALDNKHTGDALPSLYMNISGEVRGRWTRSRIADNAAVPQLNFSDFTVEGPFGPIKHSKFDGNFTGGHGDVTLGIKHRPTSRELDRSLLLEHNVTTVSAEMTLSEDTTEQEERLSLRGVHYPQIGLSMMTTTSPKFAGIFLLPVFALSKTTYSWSQVILNETIARMLAQSDGLGLHAVYSSDSTNPESNITPACEVIMYLQQFPLEESISALTDLDRELRFPTGATTLVTPPRLHFSMLAYSPDCGWVIESEGPPDQDREQANHLNGYKVELLRVRGTHHVIIFALVNALQLVSLIRQTREASTPSTRSRISFYTIAIMLFFDAMFTITMICYGMYLDAGWITTYGTAAFSLVNVFTFGMRFMADIWSVHAPELRRRAQEAIDETRRQRDAAIAAARERQQATYTQVTTEAPVPSPPGSAPQEDTDRTSRQPPEVLDFGSLPVFMPSDQAGLQPLNPQATLEAQVPTFGSIYMRFSFTLIIVIMISGSAATFSSTLRRAYFTTLMLVYLSLWTPQILRNIQRNCRKALKWEFVIGQTILRLIPTGYWFAWDENIFFIPAHRTTFALLILWSWTQVVVLASQELVGPRWFVKKDWVAPAWDYHPILRSDLEGSTLPLGLAESVSLPSSPNMERRGSLVPKDSSTPGKRVFDCAICMQNLEVPVVDAGDASEVNAAVSGSLMLARRAYMVTPCRHIFHSSCLEGWIKYRLQCPICREGLPPL